MLLGSCIFWNLISKSTVPWSSNINSYLSPWLFCCAYEPNRVGCKTVSCEEQELLKLLQAVACQVSSSSLLLPSNMPWFSPSPIPQELSHYFKMPDHYQLVRIMNQAIPELTRKAPQGTEPSRWVQNSNEDRGLAKYADNLASEPFGCSSSGVMEILNVDFKGDSFCPPCILQARTEFERALTGF